MEETVFDRKKFTRIFGVIIIAIAVFSMAAMMVYASNKVIIITADEAEEIDGRDTVENEVTETVKMDRDWRMSIKSSTNDGRIVITCPDGVECYDVAVEERILEKAIRFIFPGSDSSFFVENSPRGDFGGITEVRAGQLEDNALLSFSVDRIVQPTIKYEAGDIVLSLDDIDIDKPIVVIDPRHGGSHSGTIAGELEEKNICLDIALEIREMSKDKPYCVLLTRTADYYPSTEDRLGFVEYFGANYYIGIDLDEDAEDTKNYGMSAVYNENFYRDGYENVDWADDVLRLAVTAASDRGNGLVKNADNDVILTALTIPATVFRAGTLTNPQEAELLSSPNYVEKIAGGIIEAIDGVIK